MFIKEPQLAGESSGLEAIASSLFAIASRLEAIAIGLEAITKRLEAIALRLEAIGIRFEPHHLQIFVYLLTPRHLKALESGNTRRG